MLGPEEWLVVVVGGGLESGTQELAKGELLFCSVGDPFTATSHHLEGQSLGPFTGDDSALQSGVRWRAAWVTLQVDTEPHTTDHRQVTQVDT